MTREPCPLCDDSGVCGVVVSYPDDHHVETVDMPCRCAYAPLEAEPEDITPLEFFLK